MKKLTLTTAFFCVFLSANAMATEASKSQLPSEVQKRTPPGPVQNALFDKMVGTWEGESNMMGQRAHDTFKIYWSVNHQFLLVELVSKGVDNPTQYEGLGIYGVDDQNHVKNWWFDSWGVKAVATGQGNVKDNTLTMKDGSPNFSETRSFTVNGDDMLMTAKGSMTMNGKTIPFDQTVTYHRQ